MRMALLTVVMLGLGSTMTSAADGRYQFGRDQLRVLDTQTGAIWVVKADGKGWYIMVPVPYQSPGGKAPTQTPPKSNQDITR